MSEFNLSRNSIKKVWCIRGKVDVISAPARVQPKRGRRLTLNEVVQLQRQTQRSTQLRWQTLDQCFVTLQKVMESIMISGGVNDFKLPCVSKHVAVNGRMPMSVAVATDAVTSGYIYMHKVEVLIAAFRFVNFGLFFTLSLIGQ
ncbi:hypothetical protein JG688_00011691 [Phytophthora aleatoria]|uniref:Uncharacterized protein n=1 Tax=Phytophthora aleatoria TaxID=2496075 RepID=A0A8J5J411_9STRA|nr:hypothetical protein JG688_00011691 [Phytophthora aleatoria]